MGGIMSKLVQNRVKGRFWFKCHLLLKQISTFLFPYSYIQ